MALEPQLVTSAGTSWTQKTYGVLPIGNWDFSNEGVLLLDDGSVWATVQRKQHVFPNYEGGSQWMGTLSPEGCVQWSGDLWAMNAHKATNESEGYPDDPTPMWDVVAYGSGENEDNMWLHDGKNIYYSIIANKWGGVASEWMDGARIYKLDPSTGLTTWIAGGPWSTSSNTLAKTKDSHDGKQAEVPERLGWSTCDREYIYWVQHSPGDPGMIIRRMSLEPPYAIDTLPGLDPYPSWSDGGSSVGWGIDPSTGIPYRYDSGYIDGTQSNLWMSVGHDDTYLYLMGNDLRRIPKTGGSIETLIYAGSAGDLRSDYADSPNGAGPGLTEHYLWKGRPELEGLENQGGHLRFMGRKLFFVNRSGGTFFGNYQLMGYRFAYFDIDVIEATYEDSGPQRVNRADPQWTSVMNTTHYYEQYPCRYTPNAWYRDGGYSWGWRDGPIPLVQNPYKYFDINPNASGWENRLAFMHSEISPYLTGLGYGDNNKVTQVAAYLEEQQSAFQYNLSLQFTGDLLKGYAAAYDLNPPTAPEEVALG